jgi:hypothetical protein
MYRVKLNIDPAQLTALQKVKRNLSGAAGEIVRDAATVLQHHYVQNLSGVPFESSTGPHIIRKQTGKSAASVQVQAPYGSPYSARVYASSPTGYPGNPDRYNILEILETGRGEIIPKYTKGARSGGRGALTIPSAGGQFLAQGQNGFRGMSGNYRFVKYIRPMTGKHPLEAAIRTAKPEIEDVIRDGLDELLHN